MVKPALPPSDPTRVKLLDAAGQVFAEHGFYVATVREICARAGANVAAVNYYFGDKAQLYEEVLRQAVSSTHDAGMREALSVLQPKEALRRSIRYMLDKFCRHDRPSWTMRLMLHEMAQPTPALARVVDEIIAPNHAMVRRIVGKLLDLPPDHEKTRLCVHSVFAQIAHYANARPAIVRLWPGFEMNEETMDRIARHIADFSLAYLKARPKTSRKAS
jgi:AcrR family transcriptional regulator